MCRCPAGADGGMVLARTASISKNTATNAASAGDDMYSGYSPAQGQGQTRNQNGESSDGAQLASLYAVPLDSVSA